MMLSWGPKYPLQHEYMHPCITIDTRMHVFMLSCCLGQSMTPPYKCCSRNRALFCFVFLFKCSDRMQTVVRFLFLAVAFQLKVQHGVHSEMLFYIPWF